MSWWRIWRSPHVHDWKVVDQRIEGATLAWTGEVTRQMGFSYRCSSCPATKYEGGFYVPGDRKLRPECYGADGWPIDPKTGERLRIA